MELVERIEKFIEYKQLSVSGFERAISASNGVIRHAILKKTDIYSRFVVKILDSYPELSADWLLREEGEMIRNGMGKTKTTTDSNPDALRMIADLARENGQLQAENAELKKEVARLGSARIVSAEAAAG